MSKPLEIICRDCGDVWPVPQGRGRCPKVCGPCRSVVTGAGSGENNEDALTVPYRPRSLADHPALIARLEANGPARTLLHRPTSQRSSISGGKRARTGQGRGN